MNRVAYFWCRGLILLITSTYLSLTLNTASAQPEDEWVIRKRRSSVIYMIHALNGRGWVLGEVWRIGADAYGRKLLTLFGPDGYERQFINEDVNRTENGLPVYDFLGVDLSGGLVLTPPVYQSDFPSRFSYSLLKRDAVVPIPLFDIETARAPSSEMNAKGEIVVVAKQPGLPDRRSWRVFTYSQGALRALELPIPHGLRVRYVSPLIDIDGNFLIKGELQGVARSRGKLRKRRSLYCSGSIREQRIECLDRAATLRLDKLVEPVSLTNGLVTFDSRRGPRRAPVRRLTELLTPSRVKITGSDFLTTDADGTDLIIETSLLMKRISMVEIAADLSSKEYSCPGLRKLDTEADPPLLTSLYSLTPGTLLLLGVGHERLGGSLQGIPVTIEMTKVPHGTPPLEGELGRCLVRKRKRSQRG